MGNILGIADLQLVDSLVMATYFKQLKPYCMHITFQTNVFDHVKDENELVVIMGQV